MESEVLEWHPKQCGTLKYNQKLVHTVKWEIDIPTRPDNANVVDILAIFGFVPASPNRDTDPSPEKVNESCVICLISLPEVNNKVWFAVFLNGVKGTTAVTSADFSDFGAAGGGKLIGGGGHFSWPSWTTSAPRATWEIFISHINCKPLWKSHLIFLVYKECLFLSKMQ